MRLDLIYFLAIFILPSIARTHQSISHKFMAFGDKVSAINPGSRLVTRQTLIVFVGCDKHRDRRVTGCQPPRRGCG